MASPFSRLGINLFLFHHQIITTSCLLVKNGKMHRGGDDARGLARSDSFEARVVSVFDAVSQSSDSRQELLCATVDDQPLLSVVIDKGSNQLLLALLRQVS